uniref:RILP-like protein 2 n=1 Tax=Naja naja TaxID=35670 RepID=A0A8C7E422_NAJNA
GGMLRPREREREREAIKGPFGKSPFHLTAEDVYDISYILGRELHTLGTEPQAEMPARVARLQFKVVSILEMLETLVSESHLAMEALKLERDSLKRELEDLRQQVTSGTAGEVNPGPNKMIVDLTDVNRPRFTLQELKDVLQERNHLKAQLLFAQEELECYKRYEKVQIFHSVIFLRSRKRTVPRKENRLWAHPLALLDLKSQKQSSNGE